jgi:hypothetical protein
MPPLEIPKSGSRPLRPDLVSGVLSIFIHQVGSTALARGCGLTGHGGAQQQAEFKELTSEDNAFVVRLRR